MRTLVFDGRTGAAGDMICAALIAAGADPDVLAPVSDALPVRYEVGETEKNGIRATTVDLHVDEADGAVETDADHDHSHGDDHDHDHSHDHDADASGAAGPAEGAGVHRSYAEVVDLV
ncbi:MAG: nickel insertion protein, partial [Methanobacteriota archaeon]